MTVLDTALRTLCGAAAAFDRSRVRARPICTTSVSRRVKTMVAPTVELAALTGLAVLSACTPPTPHIDGVPGAPPNPQTPWTVPAAARTPPPPAQPPIATTVTSAIRADSATAGGVAKLSMTDVVDLALRNNPATRESWATARAAADQYGSARGALFPSFTGNVNLTRSSSGAVTGTTGSLGNGGTVGDTSGTRTTTGSVSGGGSRAQLNPGVSLSYLVFDVGGRSGTIEAAKQRAISSDLLHNTTVQNVVLQAESALFSFMATRALRDAQLIAVQEAQADTAASEARLRVGVGTLEEVLQTRTALAQAKLDLATDEGSLLAARGNLAAAMGFVANARFEVPSIPATDSVAMVASSVDTLINRAITQRPDLAGARADAAVLAAQIRIARAAGYPALTLNSIENYTQPLQGSGVTSSRNFQIVLGLQIPIFNGFSREYDVKTARELYEAGLARANSTLQQITVQVFTSYAAMQTATQRVTASVELLASAQQSSDVAVGRYREGVGTIVDVLLARTALANARADEIQARWEWRTALAQLAHDIGSLIRAADPTFRCLPRPGNPSMIVRSLYPWGGAAAVIALLVACGGSQQKKPQPATPVRVASAVRIDAPVTILASGMVEPVQSVAVTAQVSGTLLEVDFKEGDFVQTGQILFHIDPRPLRAALDQVRATLARDEAQYDAGRKDDERYQKLADMGYVSRSQSDQMHATALAQAATAQADRAALRSAEVSLGFATIRAPIAGRTGSLLVRKGNNVAPGGAALVVINQISPVLVRFPVLSQDFPVLQRAVAAHPLNVRAAANDSTQTSETGQLQFLDNAIDSLTGTVTGKASFPNTGRRMWPGELVFLTLEVSVQRGVIAVPTTAVQTGQQGPFVYVVDAKNTAATRVVATGIQVNDMTVIQKGLNVGERVVTDGQSRLNPGSRVSDHQSTGSGYRDRAAQRNGQ